MVSPEGGSKTVALKYLKPGSKMTESEFLNEAQILKEIEHPNIVRLIGVCYEREAFFTVFELEENSDLSKFLRSSQSHLLEVKDRISICHQVMIFLMVSNQNLLFRGSPGLSMVTNTSQTQYENT